jgi:hypothetical protein
MPLNNVDLYRVDGSLGSVSNIQTAAINGGPISGTRNRIINGDMRIDQRNAATEVTLATGSTTYCLDRWAANKDTASAVVKVQQSLIAPARFTNSHLVTVSTGASAGASDQNVLQQIIEGYNAADFAWGTANAQSVTVGFWVRSSVTGTYGVSFSNSAANRSYLATYTVSAANTFEYKSLTIPGDTTGTWLATNGIGIRVRWDFGSGSAKQGTSGAWGTTLFNTTSAQANVIGTTGATFYITGIQLEPGTVATPFERRSYGQELALCQRYYQAISRIDWNPNTYAGGTPYYQMFYKVSMRAAATLTLGTPGTGSGAWVADQGTVDGCRVYAASTSTITTYGNNTVASEL